MKRILAFLTITMFILAGCGGGDQAGEAIRGAAKSTTTANLAVYVGMQVTNQFGDMFEYLGFFESSNDPSMGLHRWKVNGNTDGTTPSSTMVLVETEYVEKDYIPNPKTLEKKLYLGADSNKDGRADPVDCYDKKNIQRVISYTHNGKTVEHETTTDWWISPESKNS